MANEISSLKIGDVVYDIVPSNAGNATTATTAAAANSVKVRGYNTSTSCPLVFTNEVVTSTTTAAAKTIYTDTANTLYYNPSTPAFYANCDAYVGVNASKNLYFGSTNNSIQGTYHATATSNSIVLTSTGSAGIYGVDYASIRGDGAINFIVKQSGGTIAQTFWMWSASTGITLQPAVKSSDTNTYRSSIGENSYRFTSGYFDNMYSTNGFYEQSDARLKNFIKPIDIDLDKLSKLTKSYFTWKDNKNTDTQIGVSAQEIKELYPELVTETGEGTLNVAYDKLSVVALAAVDELHKKNQELEERIARLEALINK